MTHVALGPPSASPSDETDNTQERRSPAPGGEDVWDEIITPSPQALDAALRQLNGDTTTALVLEHHGRRLYVGGGPDWFNVLAHLGYDHFYDLIGDPSLHGWGSLVLGDQLTPIPKRHLVQLHCTLRYAPTPELDALGADHCWWFPGQGPLAAWLGSIAARPEWAVLSTQPPTQVVITQEDV